ncbi:hypothetical protein RCH06_001936 [Polaromonas sp. CG_9.5]|uniref:hypothetical protein n=1 Tax=Polaromonas sp. CG_9.5 TaxID=3071705 RepID=UPI002E003E0B|nr:hypothetical protein [Polaromonas sp. CG_9.5]
MKNVRTLSRKYGAKLALATTGYLAAASAFAQSTGLDAALDAVDLSGIAVKVGAAGLLIVGIALVFKGPDLAKRIVRKV